MPHQLIFTSAPYGLNPGSGGYCTVAKSEGFPEDLTSDLEASSTYDFGSKSLIGQRSPEVYRYQFYRTSSATYFVLSIIKDAGFDHTGRTNYLAQHLVLTSADIQALYSLDPKFNPATILLSKETALWREHWEGNPEILAPIGIQDIFGSCQNLSPIDYKASKWGVNFEKPERAVALLNVSHSTYFSIWEAGHERLLMEHLLEALNLASIRNEAWRYTFTTCLQKKEKLESYTWAFMSGEVLESFLLTKQVEIRTWGELECSNLDQELVYYAVNGVARPIEPELPVAPPTEVSQAPQIETVTEPKTSKSKPDFAQLIEKIKSNKYDVAEEVAKQWTASREYLDDLLLLAEKNEDHRKFAWKKLNEIRQECRENLEPNGTLRDDLPQGLASKRSIIYLLERFYPLCEKIERKIGPLNAQSQLPESVDNKRKKTVPVLAVALLLVAIALGAAAYFNRDKWFSADEQTEKQSKTPSEQNSGKIPTGDNGQAENSNTINPISGKTESALSKAIKKYFGDAPAGNTKVNIIIRAPGLQSWPAIKLDNMPLLKESLEGSNIKSKYTQWDKPPLSVPVDWGDPKNGKPLEEISGELFVQTDDGWTLKPEKPNLKNICVETTKGDKAEIIYFLADLYNQAIFGDSFNNGLMWNRGEPESFNKELLQILNNTAVYWTGNNGGKQLLDKKRLYNRDSLNRDYPNKIFYEFKGNKWFDQTSLGLKANSINIAERGINYPLGRMSLKDGRFAGILPFDLFEDTKLKFSVDGLQIKKIRIMGLVEGRPVIYCQSNGGEIVLDKLFKLQQAYNIYPIIDNESPLKPDYKIDVQIFKNPKGLKTFRKQAIDIASPFYHFFYTQNDPNNLALIMTFQKP